MDNELRDIRSAIVDALSRLQTARRRAQFYGRPVLAAKIELAMQEATVALRHIDGG